MFDLTTVPQRRAQTHKYIVYGFAVNYVVNKPIHQAGSLS